MLLESSLHPVHSSVNELKNALKYDFLIYGLSKNSPTRIEIGNGR